MIVAKSSVTGAMPLKRSVAYSYAITITSKALLTLPTFNEFRSTGMAFAHYMIQLQAIMMYNPLTVNSVLHFTSTMSMLARCAHDVRCRRSIGTLIAACISIRLRTCSWHAVDDHNTAVIRRWPCCLRRSLKLGRPSHHTQWRSFFARCCCCYERRGARCLTSWRRTIVVACRHQRLACAAIEVYSAHTGDGKSKPRRAAEAAGHRSTFLHITVDAKHCTTGGDRSIDWASKWAALNPYDYRMLRLKWETLR